MPDELRNAYRAQIVSIYATHRRHSGKAALAIVGGLDESAEDRADDFRKLFSDQVPYVINSRQLERGDLRFEGDGGRFEEIPEILAAKLEIYALPFPADQVVAALIVDVDSPDMNDDFSLTDRLLKLCAKRPGPRRRHRAGRLHRRPGDRPEGRGGGLRAACSSGGAAARTPPARAHRRHSGP